MPGAGQARRCASISNLSPAEVLWPSAGLSIKIVCRMRSM